jgi:hypothetical protein
MHEFDISITGIEGASLIGETTHTLNGGEVRAISLRVRIQPKLLNKPSTELDFTAQASDNPSLQASAESRFVKPL